MMSQSMGPGGFIQSQINSFASVPPPNRKSLHACTIFMLQSWLGKDGLEDTIEQTRIDKVVLCGQIMDVQGDGIQQFKILLHDCTGECWCSYPGAHEADPVLIQDIIQNGKNRNDYVFVYGKWTSFQDEGSFSIFGLKRPQNYNEITLHLLKVCNVFYNIASNRRYGNSSSQMQSQSQANAMAVEAGDAEDDDGLTENEKRVKAAILLSRPPDPEELQGVNIDTILNHASLQSLPPEEIKRCLGSLVDGGQLFTTIDDDHYDLAGEK